MKARPAILHVQNSSWNYHSLQGQHILIFWKCLAAKCTASERKIKYKAQNFEPCTLFLGVVLYFLDNKFWTKPLNFLVFAPNLAAKWIRYRCTLSILRADFGNKTYFWLFSTKSAIPKDKVQDQKNKVQGSNVLYFFALYFIFLPCTLSILILQDGNGDPRIASTPTLCFSTSGMHRARVKSYRQIASAKRFQVSSYFHFATLKGKVPTQDCHVLKACTRNLGGSWHGRCSWCQFPTGPPKNGATIKALTTWGNL